MWIQVLVMDYKLTYPSGTATAVLINGFHSPQGDKNAEYVQRLSPFLCLDDQCYGADQYASLEEMIRNSEWFD